MTTAKKIILTVIHLSIFIITVIMTLRGVFKGAAAGQVGENMINLGFFKAFTVDSNDFAGITSLITAVCLVISFIKKDFKLPYWVVLLQYSSAMCVALTFITTATFLAPTQVSLGNSYFLFFSGDMFYLHLTTPITVILAYIFTEDDYKFGLKENLLGLIPLMIYEVVYFTNVIITKAWSDFYRFTFGGHNSAILPAIIIVTGVTFLMGFGMIKAHNKYISRG